ncbi:MAG: type IV pilin N-terminal domain-containing protein [Methanocorpusculum sp.]|nr:type IV pilin N-terminal domain-containing protein [Methanocorpusculum sp.]
MTVAAADDGVSPVVATILIIAMSVIMVAVAGAVFMGFTSDVTASTPIFGLSIDVKGTTVSVCHMNGEAIPKENLGIIVNGTDITTSLNPAGWTTFSAGVTLTYDAKGKVSTVGVVYKKDGTSTLLVEKKF